MRVEKNLQNDPFPCEKLKLKQKQTDLTSHVLSSVSRDNKVSLFQNNETQSSEDMLFIDPSFNLFSNDSQSWNISQ